MFKSFDRLNKSIRQTSKTVKAFNLERCLGAGKSIIDVARDLPSQYARSYSQVQWMKYDDQGNPSDVTPDNQGSAADVIVDNAKNSVADSLHSFNSVDPITVTRTVPQLVVNGCIYGNPGSGFTADHTFSFVVVDGVLKLREWNAGYAVSNVQYTGALSFSTEFVRLQYNAYDAVFYGGRVREGWAVASDGKVVTYVAGKISSAAAGTIIVSCLYNSSIYRFEFTDVSHSGTREINYSNVYSWNDSTNVEINNSTGLSPLGVFILFRSYGRDDHDAMTVTQTGTRQTIIWNSMTSISGASTTVTADISLQPEDLYSGLNELIASINSL